MVQCANGEGYLQITIYRRATGWWARFHGVPGIDENCEHQLPRYLSADEAREDLQKSVPGATIIVVVVENICEND